MERMASTCLFSLDRRRYGEGCSLLCDHGLRFLYVLRKAQSSRNPLWRALLARMSGRYGLEISRHCRVDGGLYLGHAFGITINDHAVLGRNINLHKGVTIGQENRGPRKGAPVLGNNVWIGVNATIVGAVHIGDDVLVAPNSFVNNDVPSHSVVLGNPCIIIPKNDATSGYINHAIECL